jgi:hypothetical protein
MIGWSAYFWTITCRGKYWPHDISNYTTPVKRSGYYVYHQVLTLKKFYVLLTQCIYVFHRDPRTRGYFSPLQ